MFVDARLMDDDSDDDSREYPVCRTSSSAGQRVCGILTRGLVTTLLNYDTTTVLRRSASSDGKDNINRWQ